MHDFREVVLTKRAWNLNWGRLNFFKCTSYTFNGSWFGDVFCFRTLGFYFIIMLILVIPKCSVFSRVFPIFQFLSVLVAIFLANLTSFLDSNDYKWIFSKLYKILPYCRHQIFLLPSCCVDWKLALVIRFVFANCSLIGYKKQFYKCETGNIIIICIMRPPFLCPDAEKSQIFARTSKINI